MQNQFEAPELALIGEAEDVVLGLMGNGSDNNGQCAYEFEFEED